MSKFKLLILNFLWAALILRLTTTPNFAVAPENWLNMVLMNGGHFVFFGIQALLLKLSLPIYNHRMTIVLPIIATSLFGYYIEVLQRTIPGRSYDLVDWFLDTLGAIIFIYAYSHYRWRWLHWRSHRSTSS